MTMLRVIAALTALLAVLPARADDGIADTEIKLGMVNAQSGPASGLAGISGIAIPGFVDYFIRIIAGRARLREDARSGCQNANSSWPSKRTLVPKRSSIAVII